MRLANEVKGSWHGRNHLCFRCNVQGHFARDCPKLTQAQRAAQPPEVDTQLAFAQRDQWRRDNPNHIVAKREAPQFGPGEAVTRSNSAATEPLR